jgi:hypothetical protein
MECKGAPPLGGPTGYPPLSIWMRDGAAQSQAALNTDAPSQSFCAVAVACGVRYNLLISGWIPLGCRHDWRNRTESDGYGYDAVGRERA